jgi:hypothetical protein
VDRTGIKGIAGIIDYALDPSEVLRQEKDYGMQEEVVIRLSSVLLSLGGTSSYIQTNSKGNPYMIL